ncbi:MAG: hypothetical protein PHN99_04755 [Eubacteriales bacterium]|nr:hypothetical protein [Eubacteriales bacterium]MDD4326632.1 hypothetical protein [Eubacteriales bacterium]MDD4717405.1 hypothetical protein [Eubacteriales bacterium]NCU26479.1 hypothetical protein [Candidatus Nomurabacteria bacterium]
MDQNSNKQRERSNNPQERSQGNGNSGNRNSSSNGGYRPKRNNNRRRKPRPYDPEKAARASSQTPSVPDPVQAPVKPVQTSQQSKSPSTQVRANNNTNYRPAKPSRPTNRWTDKKVRIEETYEDVCKDNERIEKEIWLEIAEIHNLRID